MEKEILINEIITWLNDSKIYYANLIDEKENNQFVFDAEIYLDDLELSIPLYVTVKAIEIDDDDYGFHITKIKVCKASEIVQNIIQTDLHLVIGTGCDFDIK